MSFSLKKRDRWVLKLQDAGANCATPRLEANAATAQKIGDRGNRFPVIPAMGADREDQIAKSHVLVGLFHGLRLVGCWKLRNPGPNRPSIGRESDTTTFEKVTHRRSSFPGITADTGHR